MSNYYTEKLGRLNQDPAETDRDEFAVMVQFQSEHGKTLWMNLTPDQLHRMAEVLEESVN